jgi:hypothetical protein
MSERLLPTSDAMRQRCARPHSLPGDSQKLDQGHCACPGQGIVSLNSKAQCRGSDSLGDHEHARPTVQVYALLAEVITEPLVLLVATEFRLRPLTKHSTVVRRELAGSVQTLNCTLRCTRMRAVELAVALTAPVAPAPAVEAVLVSVLTLLPAVEVTPGRGPPRRHRQHSHPRDSSYLGRRPTQKPQSALKRRLEWRRRAGFPCRSSGWRDQM